MFQKYFFFAILLFLSFTNAFSSDFYLAQSFSVQVGAEPAAIFYDSTAETYHIFCIGVDKNFNAIYEPDSGDIMPSWWTLRISTGNSVNYEAKKVREFDFGSILPPLRPAFVPRERAIFIPQLSKIYQYNLDTYEVAKTIDLNNEVNYDAYALDYQDSTLLISQSSYFSQSSIVCYSLKENKEILNKEIGLNTIQSVFYNDPISSKQYIATISVGPFGKDSSMLFLVSADDGKIIYEKVIGNNVNFIQNFQNKYLVITLMGSHKILIHNLTDDQEYEIPTNTTGWNGPSIAKMFSYGSLFLPDDLQTWIGIGTYNSENQIGYLTMNDPIEFNRINDYLKIDGKIEDFAISIKSSGFFIVSTQYLNEDYSPNDSVRVNFIDYSLDVNESKLNEQISFYPNPAYNHLFLNINDIGIISKTSIKIFDCLGNLLIYRELDIHQFREIDLDVHSLMVGNYYLQLQVNNNKYTKQFSIIR